MIVITTKLKKTSVLTYLHVLEIRKILKNYKERKKQNKKNGIKDDNLNNEKLLKDRIEDYVKYNEVENLKEKYKDKYYIWLPSSALVPDPQHQLLYGKKFKVGTGDKEGNMPGERWGCMCGMKILDVDENSYGMKEDRGKETKSIDNVIDGEVVRKYDEDTGIIEGTNITKDKRPIADNSKIDNRITGSNIVKDIVKDGSVRNKKDDLIVVDGDELGEYRDFKELAKKTMEYYKTNIQGTSVKRDDIGKIEFSKRGINEVVSTSKGNTDILKVITSIKEIIRQGKNLGEKEAHKIRKDKATFISINKEIKLEGIKRQVIVLLRKHPFGLDFYTLYLDLDLNKENKKD